MSKIEKLLLVLALASVAASCATLGVVLSAKNGKLGGVTNLDSLTLGADLVVSGSTTIGATTMSSLSVSGASTMTGTTTMAAGLSLNKSPICISGYATSTATRIKIEFDATAATTTSPIGGLKLNYGACN